jgi:hypothetical protein
VLAAALGALASGCGSSTATAEAGPSALGRATIPSLSWELRSDWVSVRDLGARGDGAADDTQAIQKALDAVRSGSTVYLPPGTYRVTATLVLTGPHVGVTVIGHGRDTTLVWDGDEGGVLFKDDGVAYSRFVGLQFEGGGRARVGFLHESHRRFETEVRHEHLAFRGFTEAGILVARGDKYALAETQFENCLFEDCGRGVSFISFNDYNYTFDGCEFRRCGTAIHCEHGNFYARNCRFERSRDVDVNAAPEHASSVRRCVSVGSRAFLRHVNGVSPMTIQDCRVSGWTSPDGAVEFRGAPVLMFDCVFTGGPDAKAPVRIKRRGQRVIVSGNRATGAESVIGPGHNGRVYEVPPGERGGALASGDARFLKGAVPVPGKVFDAKRDFGAKADGRTDDTAAVQGAIDAARDHGRGSIAYLPTGNYCVTDTLRVTGRDYTIGGTGFMTRLVWRGAPDGTTVGVHDPEGLTLEHIAIGHPDSGDTTNAIDVLQTGSGDRSRMTYDGVFVYGVYQKKPLVRGLHLRGLGKGATVVFDHVQGNLRIADCARATILARCSYEGSVVVEGEDPGRGGFLGFQTRLSTITTHGLYLKDNHSIVMSDFYVEQADDGFVLEGASGDPPGRVVIQGAKVDFTHAGKGREGTVLDIRDYGGEVFFGPDQFYASLPRVPVVHRGGRKLDLFLMGNCFYKTHLDPEVSPSLALHLIGNEGVAIDAKDRALSHENRAEDNMAAEDLARLVPALDELRRLGELDLELNHPRSSR